MILLDTNVISALMHDPSDEIVVRWLDRQPRASIWTTAINVYEIRFGLHLMAEGKRRTALVHTLERVLSETIQGRIAVFDESGAEHAAELAAGRQKKGRPVDGRDTMIAGIVLANYALLATRNIRHFGDIAKSVVSPWEA